jgi:hypothetical protein
VLHGGADVTEERALYPGAAAIGFTVLALVFARGRDRWVYLALVAFAFDASLGVHGLTFRGLQAALPPLGNLRASARFASLTLTALAMLAAIGAADLRSRFASRAAGPVILVLAMALCVVEFWSRPPLRDATLRPMPVDRWLATLPEDTVLLELPVPELNQLWYHGNLAPGQVDQPLAAARERLQRVHAAGLQQHADCDGNVPRRQLDRTPAPAVVDFVRRSAAGTSPMTTATPGRRLSSSPSVTSARHRSSARSWTKRPCSGFVRNPESANPSPQEIRMALRPRSPPSRPPRSSPAPRARLPHRPRLEAWQPRWTTCHRTSGS